MRTGLYNGYISSSYMKVIYLGILIKGPSFYPWNLCFWCIFNLKVFRAAGR